MPGGWLRWETRGSHPVEGVEIPEWSTVDGKGMAVFVQYPVVDTAPALPVVVLSHGLGGSHLGYATLGAHLASYGFAVLHPQFLDSLHRIRVVESLGGDEGGDEAQQTLRAAMQPLLFDPAHWVSRFNRVRAVIDSLSAQQHLPLRLRPTGVTVAGHSYGAFVTQLVLGVTLSGVGPELGTRPHPAVGCGILLSPQGSGDRGLTAGSWDGVTAPVAVITATRDFGPHGEGLSWRREPFDRVRSALKHLAVVRDSDHYLGGIPGHEDDGAVQVGRETPEQGIRRAVSAVAVAFAEWARGDAAAGDWLGSNPLPSVMDHCHVST